MPPVKCSDKPGTVFRRPYNATRSATGTTYHVKAACVEDKGLPGKIPKKDRIPATPSADFHLGDYGYETKYNKETRQAAMDKAIKALVAMKKVDTPRDGAVKIIKKLNLVSTLSKNTETYKHLHKYERDIEYLQKKYTKTA